MLQRATSADQADLPSPSLGALSVSALAGMGASVPCYTAQRHGLAGRGLWVVGAMAQTTDSPPATNNPLPIEGAQSFILTLVTQYPWLTTVLLAMAPVEARDSFRGGLGLAPPQTKVRCGFGLRGHVPAFPAR